MPMLDMRSAPAPLLPAVRYGIGTAEVRACKGEDVLYRKATVDTSRTGGSGERARCSSPARPWRLAEVLASKHFLSLAASVLILQRNHFCSVAARGRLPATPPALLL